MLSFIHTLATHPMIPAFLVANLGIGFWAHRKAKANSFEDYAVASRSLPTGVLVMTLLGTLLNMASLYRAGLCSHYGMLQLVGQFYALIGFWIIGTFIAPYLVYFDDCYTLGDLVAKMYGRAMRVFAGILSCIVCILVIIPQMQALAKVTEYLLSTPSRMSIVFLGGIIIAYSAWGGARSVSYTDVIQVILGFIAISWVMHSVVQKVGGIGVIFAGLPKEKLQITQHPAFFFKLKAYTFYRIIPVYMLTPPIIQRMLMTRDKRQVRKMWYTTSIMYLAVLVSIGFVGICLATEGGSLDIEKGEISGLFMRTVKALFAAHPQILDLLFLGLLAIGFSTIDSFLHAMGILAVRDILSPVRELLNFQPLSDRAQVVYAKLAVVFLGAISLGIAFFMGSHVLNLIVIQSSIMVYALLIIPLIIGIVGIKTDPISWLGFALVYVASIGALTVSGWGIYDIFLVSLVLGTLAYFLTHLIQNRGIVTLKRSELTVAERLWLPSWAGLKKKVMGFVKAPLHLPTLADRKVVGTPMHSLAFSMLIFALYTLSSIFSTGGVGTANFMAGIHFVGITLCCGLMLKGIWPARLKPYFPLYWFVSLFYCLPFGGTLAFFFMHSSVFDMIGWIASFTILAFLVDSASFLLLSSLGIMLSVGLWRIFWGVYPIDTYGDFVTGGIGSLCALTLGVVLFGRGKEARTSERLYWNRIASSILGHDLRGSTQMLGGAGNILEKTFEIGEPSTNGKGEKGYWLPFAQSQFLAQFSGDMSKKAASTRKEISNFLAFIQHQIMGTFEQEAVSMRAMVEEGMEKIGAKVKSSRIKLALEATKDFEAKVLAGIFPNVIFNLLMNATTHGKASEVTITIDGNTRTITVRDNGEGIPSDVLPRIFDLSYSSAGHGKENAGVGLAFAKMVLDASGAKIACHSRTGKGSFTEFVMTFEEE